MIVGLLLISATSSAFAAFPEEDIVFIVPYSPGGGFDTMARMVAPYMEEYLPNDVSVVVENRPGGNGAIGVNAIMNARPDGYTIGVFNMPGFVIAPLLGRANYDLTEVEWLGQTENVNYVAVASPESGLRSLEDVLAKGDLLAGVAGLTDTASVSNLIAADRLGFNVELIPHAGSNEALLSTIRGDTDFAQFPYGSVSPYIIGSNELTPLWVYAANPLPGLANVPTIAELGYPELLSTVGLRRFIGTTPGTPPDVVATLENALEKAMNDPELLEQMRDSNLQPEWMDGEEVAQMVREMIPRFEQYKHLFD